MDKHLRTLEEVSHGDTNDTKPIHRKTDADLPQTILGMVLKVISMSITSRCDALAGQERIEGQDLRQAWPTWTMSVMSVLDTIYFKNPRIEHVHKLYILVYQIIASYELRPMSLLTFDTGVLG